jgi:excisionase family DNA binding protein
MTPERLTIRVSKAPLVFDVSTDTIYNWAKAGRIRIYKKGGIALIKVSEVLAHIESSDE